MDESSKEPSPDPSVRPVQGAQPASSTLVVNRLVLTGRVFGSVYPVTITTLPARPSGGNGGLRGILSRAGVTPIAHAAAHAHKRRSNEPERLKTTEKRARCDSGAAAVCAAGAAAAAHGQSRSLAPVVVVPPPPPPPLPPPAVPRVYPSDGAIARSQIRLFPFQVEAVHQLDDQRGMVLSFDTGNGKTLTAVTMTQAAIDADPALRVVFVGPKSLAENWKIGLETYGVRRTDTHYEYYSFEGFANAYKVNPQLCRDAFLVVDEAHHCRTDVLKSLRRAIKDATPPRDATPEQRAAIRRLKDSAVLAEARKALTKAAREMYFDPVAAVRDATGIDIMPIAPRSLMMIRAAATARKVVLLTATPLVNSHLDARNLISMALGRAVMSERGYEDALSSELRACSWFGHLFAFRGIDPQDPDFPRVVHHELRVPMTAGYYRQYHDVELAQDTRFGDDPWAFYCGVRQGTLGISPNPKGEVAMRLISEGLPTVVYSAFKSNGIETVQRNMRAAHMPFVTVSGDTKEEARAEAVRDFNDGRVRVIFVTAAGGEGIHLRGVRKVILLETGWNDASDRQVIGRGGPRRGSHRHLPLEQQQVDVYHLVLVKPPREERAQGDVQPLGADEILQRIAHKKRRDITRIDRILRSADLYTFATTVRQAWRGA